MTEHIRFSANEIKIMKLFRLLRTKYEIKDTKRGTTGSKIKRLGLSEDVVLYRYRRCRYNKRGSFSSIDHLNKEDPI